MDRKETSGFRGLRVGRKLDYTKRQEKTIPYLSDNSGYKIVFICQNSWNRVLEKGERHSKKIIPQ